MSGPYQVILADPPWSYRNKRTGGSLTSGAAQKYGTLSLDAICALPVADIAARDSVLFLWITVPMLVDGLHLPIMRAWGFRPKTMLTWRKIMSLGLGYWFRGQTEHLILGVRGHVPAFRCQESNFIQAKVGQHSHKPEEFRALIERATASLEGPRIELFATGRRPGWDAWGSDVESDIALELASAPQE